MSDQPQLPPPPRASFASDNAAGVAPQVMEALVAANTTSAAAYGEDPWTRDAERLVRELFDAPVEMLACWGGTGANVVAIGSVIQPWQAVIAAETAHIVVDECGAPARFTGATIAPVTPLDGKLLPAALEEFRSWSGSQHHPQPALVSVSQTTEMGTVYSVEELGVLAETAHRLGMLVHVDGARIANAVVATGATLPEMLRDTGVDLVSFGLTKNGAMFGELVVYVRPELALNAAYVRKQAGQLASKGRFVSAQAIALLEDGLWLRNAAHANRMAALLAAGLGPLREVDLVLEPAANAVFARLDRSSIRQLQEWSFFWDWDLGRSVVRWMTSFATGEQDVATFLAGIEAVTVQRR